VRTAGVPPRADRAASTLLVTPVLSPARLPRTLQGLWAQKSVAGALTTAMSPAQVGAAASAHSCAEVVQGGHVVYQDHPDLPVMPASNMKLLTGTALLQGLGRNYTFATSVTALQPPSGGVVDGDLYFVGGGDPLLRLPTYAAHIEGGDSVYTDVTRLVGLLKSAGVREVTGSVVGDETRYDSARSVPSWSAAYGAQGVVGPLSAVGIDDGFALAARLVPSNAPAPVQSAGVLTSLLRSAGITVGGAPEAGQAPVGAPVLARLVSAPLGQILGEVLRESDNTAMELMTKELGLKDRGVGTTAAGIAVVRADLAADGLPLHGFVNVDGSGLSRLDRVTCALLVKVLQRAGPNGLLVQDLPVAGRSGTLADELNGTVAAGRVRAKTGTLDGVKALSGWVEPVEGQGGGNAALASPVVFSSVLNGLVPTVADPSDLTDQIALDIAEYPRAPALTMFEPG
jgi:D-alanyl-D-alanine carboxypeptidase/D-alanyl-D-alanine-endopeptidase (penicillin-binding protein 4)